MKLGAMDFLEKPVPIDELVERISTAKSTGDDAAKERTQQIIYDIISTKGW
jgi:FixJ family two-component response regulator